MHVRSLGFRTDLRLLELTGSEIEDRGTHLVIRTPDNPTFFWGNFLLLAEPPVPGGEREVIGAFHTEFPLAEHVSIGIDAEVPAESRKAFEDAGLTADDAIVLTATALTAPRDPAVEVQLRPLESDEDWDARARLSHALYPNASEETFLAFARAKNDQERRLVAAGRGVRYGAFVEDGLVATAAIFATDEGLARFQTVETHADHRRQGLAGAVVHAAAQHALHDLGATTLVMVAEAEGDAIRVYRRLGFADAERQFTLEKHSDEWAEA